MDLIHKPKNINSHSPPWRRFAGEFKLQGLALPIDTFAVWKEHCPNFGAGINTCDWIDDGEMFLHPGPKGFEHLAQTMFEALQELP